MSKYELTQLDKYLPEGSPGTDFLRMAILVAAFGAFLVGEWLLGMTALLLALVTGHGIPSDVANFRPGGR